MPLRTLIAALTLCPVLAQGAEPTLSKTLLAEGWVSLFDGETLFGWHAPENADWKVEDDAITVSKGEICWLMTTSQFADFHFVAEYRTRADTNSGVFFRTTLEPGEPAVDCFEVNIAPPSHPFPTGSVVGRAKARPLTPEQSDPQLWHTLEIVADGAALRVILDGETVTDHEDPRGPWRGHIGLQHNSGAIAFRNVRVRPLNTTPIFNGHDLTGWNTDRAEASRFEVTPEGELRVLDGRGQIETNDAFGDFALQLECRVDGDDLNGGVFFRCIPRDFMMGYESQIHHGTVDSDPTRPVDCGTGGIFRRQNARRVVSRDHEWFTKTLIATGPHVAVWVDGYQVSDWTDTRPPDENPRRGLRLEPGTIALQGHDPTTDLRFRNLRIAEYPGEEIRNDER